MWIAVLIIGIICYALYRIGWAIIEPIYVFIYDSLLNLFKSSGMSEKAAKALISLIIIAFILEMIF